MNTYKNGLCAILVALAVFSPASAAVLRADSEPIGPGMSAGVLAFDDAALVAVPKAPRAWITAIERDVRDTRLVRVTAYSSTPEQTDDTPFETALGTQVRDGVIAANFLPFGTRVRIPTVFGTKVFVVEDRMNRKHSNSVDIWMPSKELAEKFGHVNARIEVLD